LNVILPLADPGAGVGFVAGADFGASVLAAGVELVAGVRSGCLEKADRGAGLESADGLAAASGLVGGAAVGFASLGWSVVAAAGAGFALSAVWANSSVPAFPTAATIAIIAKMENGQRKLRRAKDIQPNSDKSDARGGPFREGRINFS
jgi:hypothetical protein